MIRHDPDAIVVTMIVAVFLIAFLLAWIGEKR